MKVTRGLMLIVLAALWPFPAHGQPEAAEGEPVADEQAVHEELRELRRGLVEAIEERDIERQLTYAHDDIIVTWQHGQVVEGREGLLEFLKQGESDAFLGYTQPPTPTELSILHGGDTAISYGTSVAHYRIVGQEFELTNHWSATLVKEGDEWKLANYHVSANLLDNPLLNAAKGGLYWAGGLGLVVGLIIGVLATALTRRARKQPA